MFIRCFINYIKNGFRAKDTSSNEIISLTTPKAGNYLYFNYETSFSITLDGTEITLSDASGQNSGVPSGSSGGQGGPGAPPSDQGSQPGEQGNSATVSQTESANTASTDTTSTTSQTESSDEDPEVIQTNGYYFLKRLNIIYLLGLLIL